MARATSGAVPSASAATTNLRDGHSIGALLLSLATEHRPFDVLGPNHDHVGGSPSRGASLVVSDTPVESSLRGMGLGRALMTRFARTAPSDWLPVSRAREEAGRKESRCAGMVGNCGDGGCARAVAYPFRPGEVDANTPPFA